jgi:DNA-binding MarR family transcriptional regulator
VERKLVKRAQSRSDRRVWRVSLTSKGEGRWSKIESELLAIDSRVLATLPSAQRETLIEAVEALANAAREWRAKKSREDG